MRKITLTFHFILLCLFSSCVVAQPGHSAANDATLKRISSSIEQYPVIHADFTQTKKMAALKRPLITTGQLIYLRDQGVLWQIEKPYRIAYLLSNERIVEINAQGEGKERNQRDVPGLAQIGRVFQAMLGANSNVLHEYFDVAAEGTEKKWRITLKPRHPQIAKFIAELQLSGGRFVETARISEAGGDITHIRFRNSRGAKTPSQSDKQLFSR